MAQAIDQYLRGDREGPVDKVTNDEKNAETADTVEVGGKGKKKRDGSTLRKAPQAPKRFKSSYIMFFMANQQEIKAELGVGASVGDVSKQSSDRWKTLSSDERAVWDKKAMEDKERYNLEKASYTGPWQVPWKRAKKDPNAPKRPMSAFLFFSQDKRRLIKEENPGMRNTQISRVLGEMWKKANDEEKRIHIEREAKERAKYKVDIAKWRKEDLVRKEDTHREQVEQAKLAAQCHVSYQSQPSTAPDKDDSQSHCSQHCPPSQNPSQGLNTQQYYQGNYGQSDYHVPSSQGYRQTSQYYDNSFQQEQGTYYNSSVPEPYSRYQQLEDDPFQSDPASSKYSTSNSTGGGASQYPNYPDTHQSSSFSNEGYYPPPQQESQGYHFHPNPASSYQGEFDAYTQHHSSHSPTHDISNFHGYR